MTNQTTFHLECSMSGSSEQADPHAFFQFMVVADCPMEAVEKATEAWSDEVFTGFQVLTCSPVGN